MNLGEQNDVTFLRVRNTKTSTTDYSLSILNYDSSTSKLLPEIDTWFTDYAGTISENQTIFF